MGSVISIQGSPFSTKIFSYKISQKYASSILAQTWGFQDTGTCVDFCFRISAQYSIRSSLILSLSPRLTLWWKLSGFLRDSRLKVICYYMSRPLLWLLCGDIGFVYPTLSMVSIDLHWWWWTGVLERVQRDRNTWTQFRIRIVLFSCEQQINKESMRMKQQNKKANNEQNKCTINNE
jgi:hypothetical protein